MHSDDKTQGNGLPEAYFLRRKNQTNQSSGPRRPVIQLDFRSRLEKLEDFLGVSSFSEEDRLRELGQKIAERLVAAHWKAEPGTQRINGSESWAFTGWYLKTIEHDYDGSSSWGWQLMLSTTGDFYRREYEHHGGRYGWQDAWYYSQINSRDELLRAIISKRSDPNSNLPIEIRQFFE